MRTGARFPPYSYELYAAPHAVELARIDARTLELPSRIGYCSSRSECIASDPATFRVGRQLELAGMRVEIRQLTASGMPQRVRFHFPSPLEDPARRWLSWTAQGLKPFTPPRMHEAMTLPPLSRLDAFR